MPVDYNEFTPIFPPRPEGSIRPETVDRYSGFWAQYKYHDIRNVAYVFPDGSLRFLNRHCVDHRLYRLSPEMKDAFRRLELPKGSFHVLDGGLMHGKTPLLRDRLILWDLLVYQGQYLIGTTYRERYGQLREILGNPSEPEKKTGSEIGLQVRSIPHLWLAPVFENGLGERYRKLIHLAEVEGLVLKNPAGRLEWGFRERNNGAWMIRVRKPSAMYAF